MRAQGLGCRAYSLMENALDDLKLIPNYIIHSRLHALFAYPNITPI